MGTAQSGCFCERFINQFIVWLSTFIRCSFHVQNRMGTSSPYWLTPKGVHHRQRSGHGEFFGQGLDGFVVQFSLPEHIRRCRPDQINPGRGHDRKDLSFSAANQIGDPSFHITFHLLCQASCLASWTAVLALSL